MDYEATVTILSIHSYSVNLLNMTWVKVPFCIRNTAQATYSCDNLKNHFQLVMRRVMPLHSVTRSPICINLLFPLNWTIQAISLVYFFRSAFLHSKALQMQWQQLMCKELIQQYIFRSSILAFNIANNVYSIYSINNHANMLKMTAVINTDTMS